MTAEENSAIRELRGEVTSLRDTVVGLDKRLDVDHVQRDAERREVLGAIGRLEEAVRESRRDGWTPRAIAAVIGGIVTALGALGIGHQYASAPALPELSAEHRPAPVQEPEP